MHLEHETVHGTPEIREVLEEKKGNLENNYKPLPIKGYTDQSGERIRTVNTNKGFEEIILRHLDGLSTKNVDQRWLAIACTHIEQGFMALNRSIFRPERVMLDGDNIPNEKEKSP